MELSIIVHQCTHRQDSPICHGIPIAQACSGRLNKYSHLYTHTTCLTNLSSSPTLPQHVKLHDSSHSPPPQGCRQCPSLKEGTQRMKINDECAL